MPLSIPTVTETDLLGFHAAHFPDEPPPTALFPESHTDPDSLAHSYADAHYSDEPDLGTYADGTPRTLTADEIAIFRHSELETLLRARQKQREAAEAEAEAKAAEAVTAGDDADAEGAVDWAGRVFGGRFPASFFESVDAMEGVVEEPSQGMGDGERRKKKKKKRAPRPGKGQREKQAQKEEGQQERELKREREADEVEEGPYGKRRVDKSEFESAQGMTYRRMAREADEAGGSNEHVELDY